MFQLTGSLAWWNKRTVQEWKGWEIWSGAGQVNIHIHPHAACWLHLPLTTLFYSQSLPPKRTMALTTTSFNIQPQLSPPKSLPGLLPQRPAARTVAGDKYCWQWQVGRLWNLCLSACVDALHACWCIGQPEPVAYVCWRSSGTIGNDLWAQSQRYMQDETWEIRVRSVSVDSVRGKVLMLLL